MESALDKDRYIAQEQLKLTQSFAALLFLFGSGITLMLSVLDYLVTPENFSKFLTYRMITAILILIMHFIVKLKKERWYQITIVIISAVVISSMVELMILSFGGHQSPYYAGMIIIFIFMFGFLPLFSVLTTLVIAAIIYCAYLFPILLFDTITDIRIFLNNNIFLVASISVGLIWRYHNDNLIVKKLSLEYDLSLEKDRLSSYSSHLEDVVQDRTKELRKSQVMLQTLYDNANDGIVTMDVNGLIISVNEKAMEMYGFSKEQMLGLNISLLEMEKNKNLWEERMHRLIEGESLIFETEHYRKDGSTIVVEVSAKAIRVGGDTFIQSILRDITEKKRLRSQLLHAQKMESIGTLAGGMAHDFNNILSAILGFTDIILHDENPTPSIADKLRVVESSARKGSVLISKLLSFSRRGHMDAVTFNMNDIIEEMTEMLGRLIPKTITVKTELDRDVPAISGDVSQIEQMVMNLVINARDAMPDGGTIRIKTSIASLDDGSLPILAGIRSGSYVHLKIRDNGVGIPEGYLDRIYEPFFTTKDVGKGTGLGLAMVYGIVKDHKGYITVESEQGKGTVFHVYLPTGEAPGALVKETGGRVAIQGEEQILVIDDEVPVLELIRQTLLKEGYDIAAFTSPLDAIDYFKSNRDHISLVVTDIVMPDMSGEEIIEAIRELDKEKKIIAITGFSRTLKTELVNGFLRKPFERSSLVTLVKQLMDQQQNTRTGLEG